MASQEESKTAEDKEAKEKCSGCKTESPETTPLPCQHKLCPNCVKKYVASPPEEGPIHCPVCHQDKQTSTEGQKPGDGSATEDVNEAGDDSKDDEAGSSGEASKEPVACANKGHGPAQTFCIDCVEFHCIVCTAGHQLYDVMSSHRLRLVEAMSSSQIAEAKSTYRKKNCSRHKGQDINIYCVTCKQPMCTTCCLLNHQHHKYGELAQAAIQAKGRFEKVVKSTEEYIQRQEDLLSNLQETDTTIRNDFQLVRSSVEELTTNICQAVCKDIEMKEEEVLSKVESTRIQAESNKADAIAFRSYVEGLVNSEESVTQLERAPSIEEQFRQQKATPHESLTWKLSFDERSQTDASLQAILGKVSLRSSLGANAVKDSLPGLVTLGKHLHSIPLSDSSKKVVSGLCVIGRCLCVTHAKESFLWLHDMVSGTSQMCDVPQLEKAMGMAVKSQAERSLIITDKGTNGGKLHFLNIEAHLVFKDHQVKQIPVKSPRGVSVVPHSGQILVGQDGQLEFAICSPEGDFIKNVKLSQPLNDQGQFCDAWHVVKVRQGYAALVWDNNFRSTILWVDNEGQLQHVYDQGQDKSQTLVKAYSMVKDSQGRVVVTDFDNHRLHLVNPNMKLSQFLLTKKDGLRSPACLYLDERAGRLYVAQGGRGSREVRVYGWPSATGRGGSNATNYELDVRLGKLL